MLFVDSKRHLQGSTMGPRWQLHLKPNKTNQSGEENTVKSFIIGRDPNKLSEGQAIPEMLKGDPEDDERIETRTLFCNPATGQKTTHEDCHAALNEYMAQSVYRQQTIGIQSLPIRVATAYRKDGNEEYAISGFMSQRASEGINGSTPACTPHRGMAARQIGRAAT